MNLNLAKTLVATAAVFTLGIAVAQTLGSGASGMATIGHWQGETMDHEWLFWDNQDFMKQLGLAD